MSEIFSSENNAFYLFKIVFSDSCEELSNLAQKLTAAAVICIVVFVNCASVRLSTRFLTVFSFGKILSLTIIIIGGIVMLAQGKLPIKFVIILVILRQSV